MPLSFKLFNIFSISDNVNSFFFSLNGNFNVKESGRHQARNITFWFGFAKRGRISHVCINIFHMFGHFNEWNYFWDIFSVVFNAETIELFFLSVSKFNWRLMLLPKFIKVMAFWVRSKTKLIRKSWIILTVLKFWKKNHHEQQKKWIFEDFSMIFLIKYHGLNELNVKWLRNELQNFRWFWRSN